ncbi:MmgE/PrpD family protein [Candidimonas nitroreducens]|uniref:2-methylcitrate dehydratase n=1 Tax=Candidimonas nitroreducens TaxID=683354 RepID=A0A225M4M3_9BURK|nr:MmgE/PrpD family protein [Candidimonas nitroreducens]OWT56228.1 hypothetical protein CEY11_19590 [Candidimonas nitroreducens]
MALTQSLNRQLAVWASNLDLRKVPPEVVHATKLRILDIVGAMLGGLDTELVQQVSAATPPSGAPDAVGLPGFDIRTNARDAALLMGTMACVIEYDDSHVSTGVHPGSPIVATALALGQHLDVSGKQLIRSVLLGNELTCRLGLVAPGAFHRVGFHPTGMVGAFGAAYTAANLYGLNTEEIQNATGISGSFASGIMASWEDGTSAKSLHAGWGAAAGIEAVRLACHGVTGPAGVFEGRFGFYRAHVQNSDWMPDHGAAVSGLGERWELLNIAPRAYPCGHYIQPFIDAALWIAQHKHYDPADISKVVCLVADYMVPLICEPAAEKARPMTTWHARYSLPFCIAECLLSRSFTKHSLSPSQLVDHAHTVLSGKVGYEVNLADADRAKWSGEVRVTLHDGSVLKHRINHMRGTPENPMTEEDLMAKFMGNAQHIIAPQIAEDFVDRVMRLENQENVRTTLSSICRPGGIADLK